MGESTPGGSRAWPLPQTFFLPPIRFKAAALQVKPVTVEVETRATRKMRLNGIFNVIF